MVCKSITKYLDFEDKFKIKIRNWAEQDSPGFFKCSVCRPTKVLSFAQGKLDLLKHAESLKHKKAWLSQENTSERQLRIDDLHKSMEGDNIASKSNDLELALGVLLAKHDVPFAVMERLEPLLKKCSRL